ncbi:uncharacterized protein BP5553_01160 [Venustampulla echinocandica]|uniref:WSC domain-containing protein n=1 Tax=Venustampulla echinocandica TaxID=2656787 RepID=A0A370U077_9HELO|nr:uncharacterized protein BP5553_01160 [Venustampulla echinocandica]RDL41181.1 hypothetical protein BP5553_01160 [Venustampulla echinocandica]
MHFTKSSLLAALASSASAYSATQRTFAVNHFYGKGPLVSGRMDPLTNPGEASGHAHTIQGGNAFALTMTDDQALKSTCTSSLVKNDKSNYWTPSLYFKDPKTGMLESVEMFYMNVYYFFEPTTDKIKAFPPGLRILIGDPKLRTPPKTGGKNILDLADGTPQPIQFTCPRSNPSTPLYPTNSDGLHGVGIQDPGNKGAGVGFPDQNCDGYASPLRADIHFPSCYNPAAGLQNYKENMQFPTKGNCPEGWIHTPHMFYEVYWNTPVFKDRWTQGQGTQPFVLSNGDPTGYSLHGDFIAGWDVNTLQQIIDNCDAGDSGMDKCPGLIGGLHDSSTSCKIQSPIQETIFGTMSALPGKNPIGDWGVNVAGSPPAAAAPVSTAAPSAPAAPSPTSTKPIKGAVNAEVPTEVKPVVSPAPVAGDNGDAPGATGGKASSTTLTKAPVAVQEAEATGGPGVVTSYVYTTEMFYKTVTTDAAAPVATGSSSAIAGWTYTGCYEDDTGANRVLKGVEFADVGQHSVTNTKCVDYCGKRGFSMAGTEYGGQCFCGNSLVKTTKIDDSRCSMPCEGDKSQVCGGAKALSIYTNSAAGKIRRSVRARHLN